jgi:phosphoenolpyruvate synthase/pyruvate phosphate dikinase
MCEIPSNVVLVEEFCQLVDGISIGSNDLTQLTLGIDRDSEILAPGVRREGSSGKEDGGHVHRGNQEKWTPQ